MTFMSLFQYDFMRRAFVVAIALGIVVPCIGVIVVLKRLSMMGDALAHTSLAGVAGGLLAGINPVLGAGVACIGAAFTIEWIRKKMPQYAEISIAIVLSTGVGLAGVLSGFIKNATGFNAFLFGSIVAISNGELIAVVAIALLVFLSFLLLYKELFYIALDERSAALSGVPVQTVNFIFTLLTAMTVAIAARTVGALIVSSMMVLPVACSLQLARSYRQTVWLSIIFGLSFTLTGLVISFYAALRPGGAIVLTGVCCLLLIFGFKKLIRRSKSDF